jgi:cell division protein FtsQ
MERSRRPGAKVVTARPARGTTPPASSRLTIRAAKNRRVTGSVWSRLPAPREIAESCGRIARRALPAVAAVAAIGMIGTGAAYGYRFVTHSPRFAITAIEIRGTHHLAADDLRRALPVQLGDNVFAPSLDNLARAVRDNPWVASVEAHRVLPHTIVVDITERTPAALVDLGGLYLADAAGKPFKRAAFDADDGAGLPVITGLDRAAYIADPEQTAGLVRDALAALATWNTGGERPAIGEVHVDAHGALTLHTYDDATAIQLGTLDPAQLAPRIDTFDAAWAQLSDTERLRARAIHLDSRPDHVTVAFASSASPTKD